MMMVDVMVTRLMITTRMKDIPPGRKTMVGTRSLAPSSPF